MFVGATLLIFGLRVLYRAVGQGMFYCRRCGGDRKYVRRAGRRWFTLLCIPVFPVHDSGEHVMCVSCRTRYVTEVLALPTTAQMQVALTAGMRAAAAAMLRSGDVSSPVARQRAIAMAASAGSGSYDDDALAADLLMPDELVRPALQRFGAQLTVQAREWYLADVIGIGMADGALSDAERGAAQAIGLDLGMTQAQVVGVVAMTEQSAGQG
jgi:hypothetical protein